MPILGGFILLGRQMVSSLNIRPAKKEDLPSLCKLHALSVKSAGKKFYSSEQMEAWACSNPEKYTPYLETEQLFVAENDNLLVGFGIIHYEAKEIRAVYLDPQYFGKGYGKAILNFLELKAKDLELSQVTLGASLNARNFYERNGYNFIKEDRYKFKNTEIPVFLMSKSLN